MSNAIDLPDPDTAWWRCTGADLARTLQDLETLRCRVEAIQGRVLAEVASRGVFAEYGYGTARLCFRSGTQKRWPAVRAQSPRTPHRTPRNVSA